MATGLTLAPFLHGERNLESFPIFRAVRWPWRFIAGHIHDLSKFVVGSARLASANISVQFNQSRRQRIARTNDEIRFVIGQIFVNVILRWVGFRAEWSAHDRTWSASLCSAQFELRRHLAQLASTYFRR